MISVAIIGFLILALIAVVMIIDKVLSAVSKIFKINKEIDLLIDVSDETSKLAPVLNYLTDDFSVSEFVAMEISEIPTSSSEKEEMTRICNEMDTTIIIDPLDESKDHILYGDRRLGVTIFTDVALPGRKTGRVGVVVDNTDVNPASVVGGSP